MEQLDRVRKLVQNAIDKGATSVEEVHKQIASLPLDALKQVAPLAGPAETAGDLANAGIGAVYDAIRTVNEQVVDIASKLLGGTKSDD